MEFATASRPCTARKPFQAAPGRRHVRSSLCVRAVQGPHRDYRATEFVKRSAAALAAATIALDPAEQRKQLQETVGSKEGPSRLANLEDATLDNPNDSPPPADRSKQQQPLVSRADKQARLSQFEASKAAAGSVDDSQVDPSYAGTGRGSTFGGN